jgi:putative ATP-binding cassette transporter
MPRPGSSISKKVDPDIDQTIVNLDPDNEHSQKLRRRLLLRRFWQSAASLWRGAGSRAPRLLIAAIFLLILLSLAASYGMNIWNRAIFDALEKHDSGRVLFLSSIYFPLLALSVCFMAIQVYAHMTNSGVGGVGSPIICSIDGSETDATTSSIW